MDPGGGNGEIGDNSCRDPTEFEKRGPYPLDIEIGLANQTHWK